MPNVRGSAILARVDWVKKHHGPDAVAALVSSLPAPHADAVRGTVIPTLWVPFETFIALSEAIDRKWGAGDLELCRTLGRHSADVNLPTLYRIFYKLGSVSYILSKAAALWSAHYDSGRATTRDIPSGGLVLRVDDFATPHRAHCLAVLGWVEQSVVITGATTRGGREIMCRTRGDDACEFRVDYD